MNMLYGGYKHPLLTIASPNRYLNPAMQWDYYMPKAVNSACAPDRARREMHSRIWTSMIVDVAAFEHSFANKI